MRALNQSILAMAIGLALTSSAFGQPQTPANPVAQHYRAYRAAIERGDLQTAEVEASAALEASNARDGDGGSTGVLAINLAQARLNLKRPADAYEPARRALTIASRGNSNVDPLLARLVLGRAELTEPRWRQWQGGIQQAIEEARKRADLNAETYNAAADLGHWLFQQEQYAGALFAWEVAMEKADLAGAGNELARAESRMGHAAALFVEAMAATNDARSRPKGTRINLDADQAFNQADRELVEAQNIVGPFALVAAEGGGVTLGQRIFASALAWRMLVASYAESRGLRNLPDRNPDFQRLPTDARPSCPVRVIAEPRPQFPPGAQSAFSVGAAVVRFSVDENGQVSDRRVAATIPDRWFRQSIERVAPQWRLERRADAAPNCRYDPIVFVPIRFTFAR